MQADAKHIARLVKTARGQLDGILKMIEEDRYCLEVSNQLMAAQSVLKRANREILAAHMQGCVRHALEKGDSEEKLRELTALIEKLLDA